MQFKSAIVALALAASATAQSRPSNTSICDYYTTALLKDNTAKNQLMVLTLLVNTAVIGNYTKPQIPGVTFPDVAVTGILNNGTINGTKVNLLPYFNGGLASSNRGGSSGVAINFLDDGGAAPLLMNMPSNGTNSNQYKLLTHLYEFFGTLLGCSQQGMSGYPAYGGFPSMFAVHKYMDLNNAQTQYFIEQVGLSAMSFGVAKEDVAAVGMSLATAFGYKCAPNVTLTPALGSQQQSICIADDCPTAANSTCDAYPKAMLPAVANASLAMGIGNSSASPSASGTASTSKPTISTAGAAHVVGSGLAAGLGLFAFLL